MPFDRPASKACTQSASYAPLAQLPPGIVATDVSYGPFLLALTPHSVLAGPYHHLSKGIVAAHRSLAAPPEQARADSGGATASPTSWSAARVRPTASPSPSAAAACGAGSAPARFRTGSSRSAIGAVRLSPCIG